MSNSFNNEPSFPATFTTPAAMSSFIATQKFFSPTPSVDATASPSATTPDAETSVPDALGGSTSKTSAAGKTTSARASTKASTSTAHTSSSPSSTAGATSNPLVASGSTISTSLTSPTGSTLSTSFTSPAAASATSEAPGVLSEAKSCTGMCSPGVQAAVAVPVTLIGLGIIIALIIFARRRRGSDSESAASNGEPRGSKWARHLRVFSFDAELLIGGQSSRATSVRSQPTTRSHPSLTSLRSHQPSIRSLESPAPPYRDALAASGMQMAMRPESQLTAPPPYRADRASHQPNSRLSAMPRPVTAASDPFADPDDDEPSPPVSPSSVVGRSPYQPVGADADADADDVSIILSHADATSETGSVREAEVARRVGGVRQS